MKVLTSNIWSRKGIPVSFWATPEPSKFIETITLVSFVTLLTSPIRPNYIKIISTYQLYSNHRNRNENLTDRKIGPWPAPTEEDVTGEPFSSINDAQETALGGSIRGGVVRKLVSVKRERWLVSFQRVAVRVLYETLSLAFSDFGPCDEEQ